jgi:putative phage-type endonuclease
MIILNIEQKSEAWYEARAGRVTSTRFKSLVAKETTDTYKDLITNLACEIITGRSDEGFSNALMEEAIAKEPIARLAYEVNMETAVRNVGFIIPDEGHKYHNWIGDSPDGLIIEDSGCIEIKCPLMRTHFEYIVNDKLPSEYRYQVQGHLFVTGLKYCDFVSYVDGMKLFVVRVYPDLELFAEYERRLDLLIPAVESAYKQYQEYNIFK